MKLKIISSIFLLLRNSLNHYTMALPNRSWKHCLLWWTLSKWSTLLPGSTTQLTKWHLCLWKSLTRWSPTASRRSLVARKWKIFGIENQLNLLECWKVVLSLTIIIRTAIKRPKIKWLTCKEEVDILLLISLKLRSSESSTCYAEELLSLLKSSPLSNSSRVWLSIIWKGWRNWPTSSKISLRISRIKDMIWWITLRTVLI